jgi:hypothetical protein
MYTVTNINALPGHRQGAEYVGGKGLEPLASSL